MNRHVSNLRLHKTIKLVKKFNQQSFFNLILAHLDDKSLDWSKISRNPNITIEQLQLYLKKSIYKPDLSHNKNLAIENIRSNQNYTWDWYYISECDNITMEDISNESYP